MGRLITTAALLAALLASPVLSGCSGDGGASTPTPSPTPTSTSPTASPTPQPPAMPEAARAHTPEGAEAFVRHFWAVVDYASANLDPDAVQDLVLESCTGCQGGIASLEEIRRNDGRVNGGATTLTDFNIQLGTAADLQIAIVRALAKTSPQEIDYPEPRQDVTRPAAKIRFEMVLHRQTEDWRVGVLKTLP